MTGQGFAVIDLETTGFNPKFDRVVEVAVVHVDREGRLGDRFETLVNPERDIPNTRIHRITPRDTATAPVFADIVDALIDLVDGRAIVAHNAAFDLRMLGAELRRLGTGGEPFEPPHLCTQQFGATLGIRPTKLLDCCKVFGVPYGGDAHRAMVDALATAALLSCYMQRAPGDHWGRAVEHAGRHAWPRFGSASVGAWVTRELANDLASQHFLARVTKLRPDVSGPEAHQAYLSALDECLLDRQLSVLEQERLVGIASNLGIGRSQCEELHSRYLLALARAAWADDIVTDDERRDLAAVATLLGQDAEVVDAALTAAHELVGAEAEVLVGETHVADAPALHAGDTVVLTGTMRRERTEWVGALAEGGVTVGNSVTKKTRFVFAADPDSMSGKAKDARAKGVPVLGEDALERMTR